jgi:hypothetical protein
MQDSYKLQVDKVHEEIYAEIHRIALYDVVQVMQEAVDLIRA